MCEILEYANLVLDMPTFYFLPISYVEPQLTNHDGPTNISGTAGRIGLKFGTSLGTHYLCILNKSGPFSISSPGGGGRIPSPCYLANQKSQRDGRGGV